MSNSNKYKNNNNNNTNDSEIKLHELRITPLFTLDSIYSAKYSGAGQCLK